MLIELIREINRVEDPNSRLGRSTIDAIALAAIEAKSYADTLTSFLDGQEDDELGQLLAPIRDFLIELSAE